MQFRSFETWHPDVRLNVCECIGLIWPVLHILSSAYGPERYSAFWAARSAALLLSLRLLLLLFLAQPRNSWRDRTRVKARGPTHQRLALMRVRRCERFGWARFL